MVRKQTADNDELKRHGIHRQRDDVSVKKTEEGPSKLSGIQKKPYCLINMKKGEIYDCTTANTANTDHKFFFLLLFVQIVTYEKYYSFRDFFDNF